MSLSESLPETHKSLSNSTIRLIQDGGFESYTAENILIWAIGNFHPRLALSASFGAPEGMVLLDMMHRIEPTTRVFAIDTGRLPQATHDLIDRVRERYGKPVEILFPETGDLQELVRERGVNSFYESLEYRRHCCEIRKVAPMRRHLSTLDAYVTGLRRDQNAARASTRKVLLDGSYAGVVKINPLADWDSNRVWQYVRKHNVPVNRLHRSGYPSVGCEPCSRSIQPGSDPRSGRWWWEQEDTKECGLHDQEQEQGSGI